LSNTACSSGWHKPLFSPDLPAPAWSNGHKSARF